MEVREKEDQLCWNCKRCTNPAGLECPWAAKGVPVEGWTSAQGREYYKYDLNGKRSDYIGPTYLIKDCPLYIRDKAYGTYAEALNHISDVLGIKPTTIGSSKTLAYIEKYERITGEKVPDWIKYHNVERKLFGNSSKTLDR